MNLEGNDNGQNSNPLSAFFSSQTAIYANRPQWRLYCFTAWSTADWLIFFLICLFVTSLSRNFGADSALFFADGGDGGGGCVSVPSHRTDEPSGTSAVCLSGGKGEW